MSVKNSYRLINPYVEGSIDTIVSAKNARSAGKHLYNAVSKYFTNHVEDFNFAIQNIKSKDITHFKINEKRDGTNTNTVDYNMIQLPDEVLSAKLNEKLMDKVDELEKQTGGKGHFDDDSSISDSSSSDDYLRRRDNIYVHPITRFTYFNLPYLYNTTTKFIGLNANDYKSLFMPVFSWPISPVVEIRMDLYKS
uniref:Uncharacterized protein n=1 Tax=viral metagenome TaxID=1070528 RepID=A0A6C0CBJ4_9ZZZZ